eukprot:TRINITY_DN115345_c0_g1_i1.p1 TRINITY_DN115345_c0_g1~~TRINITY_DN115345_c0_g1_i1.p1  ORF type:complete len:256 (+),score=52.95 TRINITY_DN115345_c0_g1_i1:60-827(+)
MAAGAKSSSSSKTAATGKSGAPTLLVQCWLCQQLARFQRAWSARKPRSERECEDARRELLHMMMDGGHAGIKLSVVWNEFPFDLARVKSVEPGDLPTRIRANIVTLGGNYINLILSAAFLYGASNAPLTLGILAMLECGAVALPGEWMHKFWWSYMRHRSGLSGPWLQLVVLLVCHTLFSIATLFNGMTGVLLGILGCLVHASIIAPDEKLLKKMKEVDCFLCKKRKGTAPAAAPTEGGVTSASSEDEQSPSKTK